MNFSRRGVIFFPPTISSIKYFQSAWYLKRASFKNMVRKRWCCLHFPGLQFFFLQNGVRKDGFAEGPGGRGVGVEKFLIWGLVIQVCSDCENL